MDTDEDVVFFGPPIRTRKSKARVVGRRRGTPRLWPGDFEPDTDQVIPFGEGVRLWERCSTPCEDPEEIDGFDPDEYPLR